MMDKINILLAEEQKIVREGIKSLLKDEPGITVTAEAKNGRELMERLNESTVELAIIDQNLPALEGMETARQIKQSYQGTKVLILSMIDTDNYILKGFDSGADGYLLKNTGKDELMLAINKIMEGDSFICSGIACILMQKIKENGNHLFPQKPSVQLSDREMEILQLIGQGFTNSEIAEKIFTSRRTVESHRKKLIEKTNSRNTATLIRYAVMNGMLK